MVEGESRLDTSAVTGEPVPVKVKPGDEIVSGCVNTSGLLKVKVSKVLGDSMVSRILKSVEEAAASKPRIENFITRFARIYTPIVVAIAAFTAICMPLILNQDFYPWIHPVKEGTPRKNLPDGNIFYHVAYLSFRILG